MTTCDHNQPIHTALRAAVHGGSFTSLVRFLSLKMRVICYETPPIGFYDERGNHWIRRDCEQFDDYWICEYFI